MNPDHYPSVTIVAGDIKPARQTTVDHGALLRMNGGQIYIHISTEQARQWLPVISKIAGEN
jgi:hypothetical protein